MWHNTTENAPAPTHPCLPGVEGTDARSSGDGGLDPGTTRPGSPEGRQTERVGSTRRIPPVPPSPDIPWVRHHRPPNPTPTSNTTFLNPHQVSTSLSGPLFLPPNLLGSWYPLAGGEGHKEKV